MAGMLVAAVALLQTKHADLRVRFLLSQFLPLYGLFAFLQPEQGGPAELGGAGAGSRELFSPSFTGGKWWRGVRPGAGASARRLPSHC